MLQCFKLEEGTNRKQFLKHIWSLSCHFYSCCQVIEQSKSLKWESLLTVRQVWNNLSLGDGTEHTATFCWWKALKTRLTQCPYLFLTWGVLTHTQLSHSWCRHRLISGYAAAQGKTPRNVPAVLECWEQLNLHFSPWRADFIDVNSLVDHAALPFLELKKSSFRLRQPDVLQKWVRTWCLTR